MRRSVSHGRAAVRALRPARLRSCLMEARSTIVPSVRVIRADDCAVHPPSVGNGRAQG
jgi:hypothetical protein